MGTTSEKTQAGKAHHTPHLFAPLTIRGVTLKNRIMVSPMCQYSSIDGKATDWHLVHLGSRAVGGAALVCVEATAVQDIGRISPEDMGLWKDEQIEPLARIAKFIKEQNCQPAIQLAHAGRKACTSKPWEGGGPIASSDRRYWQAVAPSAIPFDENYQTPHELTEAEIQKVKEDFVAATKRAVQAGFTVIELHAAHGYLLHEFLSPLSNHRNDKYGGSLENRLRVVIETAEAMRKAMPNDMPLFVRISATDWAEGGWDPDQSVVLAKRLKEVGVDLIDCSSGALVPHVRIPVGPGYQVQFAAKIREQAHILTGAVGMITDSKQAEQILVDAQADLIIMAREMLRDPYWALHAAQELDAEGDWPDQYLRGKL